MRGRARLAHLSRHPHAGPSPPVAESSEPGQLDGAAIAEQEWLKTRTDRYIVDHMLRNGHLASASSLAAEAHVTVRLPGKYIASMVADDAFFPTQELVNQDIFINVQPAIDGLKNRNCSPALAWCTAHRQRLHKLKVLFAVIDRISLSLSPLLHTKSCISIRQSTLEFDLRLQEFVEFARGGDFKGAIQYARKHLATMATKEPQHLSTVQRALGSLAFADVPKPQPYQVRACRFIFSMPATE